MLFTGWHFSHASVNPSPVYRHFTTEDGLPSSEVYHVMQDSKGYLWFSTDNGVSRYDGYEFTNFEPKDGLPDPTIFRSFEDHNGKIWFVSFSGKLSYFWNNKIVTYQYNEKLLNQLNDIKLFTDFYVDKEGNIYIGIIKNGLFVIDSHGNINRYYGEIMEKMLGVFLIEEYPFVVSSKHEFPTPNKKKYFWAIDSLGYSKTFRYPLPKVGPMIYAIKRNSDKLLVAAGERLMEFSDSIDFKITDFGKSIIWVYEQEDNSIWLGTYLNGVYYFPEGDISNTRPLHFLKGKSVSSINVDHEKGIWLTTLENGVYYFPSKKTLTISNQLFDDQSITDLIVKNDTSLLIGFNNRTIVMLEENKVDTITFETENSSIVNLHLYYDKQTQHLITSGSFGIYSIDLISNQINNICCSSMNISILSVKDLWVAQDSGIWLAMNWGIVKVKSNNIQFYLFKPAPNYQRIETVMEDSNGQLWVGNLDGLWQLYGDSFSFFGDKHPLLSERLTDLSHFKDFLLMGTKGKGIILWKNDSIFSLNRDHGLSGNTIKNIHVDQHIWVATKSGLSRVQLVNDDWEIINYSIDHGLCSNEIIKTVTHQETVYVVTAKGISYFPSTYEPVNMPPLLRITNISSTGTYDSTKNQFFLPYQNHNFMINYTGISFKANNNITYRYQLEGIDTGWVYTGNTNVRYSGLREGNYRFLLQAKTINSKWSETVYSPQIQISPPWWRTWWAYSSYLTFGFLFILGLVKWQRKLMKKREANKLLVAKNIAESKLQALRAQMNPHFTFNTLNSINHFILENEKNEAQKYLTKFALLLRRILEYSDKDKIPLKEEIEMIKIYIELERLRFEQPFNYKIHIDKSVKDKFIEIPPMIIQPFVENSIKHGLFPLKDRCGLLSLKFEIIENYLICEIEDNGIGREKAAELRQGYLGYNKQSKGIEINSQRLQLMDLLKKNIGIVFTDLKDEKNIGCGTKVTIKIPLTNSSPVIN